MPHLCALDSEPGRRSVLTLCRVGVWGGTTPDVACRVASRGCWCVSQDGVCEALAFRGCGTF
jgi:hypothetical protein